MKYLQPLSEIADKDPGLYGGKAISLAKLHAVGLPVPKGSVLSNEAFKSVVHNAGIEEKVINLFSQIDTNSEQSINEISEEIQGLILSVEIPDIIKQEIYDYLQEEDIKNVAIRSSASAEDGSNEAWAGQLDSFINPPISEIINKIKECWASLYTPRAISYRLEKQLLKTDIAVAVIIQEVISSEKSGIVFSVNPVTKDTNQIIIEAGFGLGEAVVSGSITPDSYLIQKDPQAILEKTVSEQPKGLFIQKDYDFTWENIEDQGNNQVLNESEILRLTDLVTKIESHFKTPQDIEWTFKNGEFYILQSRPITTLDV